MLIECFDCFSKPLKGENSRVMVDFYCTGTAVGHFMNTCLTKLFHYHTPQYNLQILFLVCALQEIIQTTALGLDPFSGPRVSGRGWFASTQQNPSFPRRGEKKCLLEISPGLYSSSGWAQGWRTSVGWTKTMSNQVLKLNSRDHCMQITQS